MTNRPDTRTTGAAAAAGGDGLADFAQHRDLLFTVGYEITGSIADAEDVVQETYLRWAELDDDTEARSATPGPISPGSPPGRRSTGCAADRAGREDYVGPWLPEPLVTAPDVADDVVLAESVSMAMMLVVREPFAGRAGGVRAARGVRVRPMTRSPRPSASPRPRSGRSRTAPGPTCRPVGRGSPADDAVAAQVVERFLTAAVTGDLQGLMDVLAPDVVMLADGGGKVQAPPRPIVSADNVARLLVGWRAGLETLSTEPATVNGRPGALFVLDGLLDTVATFDDRGRPDQSGCTWSAIRRSCGTSAAPVRPAGSGLARSAGQVAAWRAGRPLSARRVGAARSVGGLARSPETTEGPRAGPPAPRNPLQAGLSS